MSAPEQTKVLVLGAGIGGLTAAVALRRAGFEVEVHERASELRPAGSGIAMLWNSLRALGSLGLGLEERLAEVGGVPTGFRFAKPDGRTIRAFPQDAIVAPDGLRSLTVHRGDLQRVLLDALDRPVQLGRLATGFSQDGHGVRVRFADGGDATGDLLVAADGIHSVVRAKLHGAEPPRPGGFVCWLATIPFEHPLVGEGYSTHFWGRGKRFGLHDIGGGRVYWWGTKTTDEPWSGTLADVRAEFAGWAPECLAAIDATDEAQLIAVPAQDRAPLEGAWGEGRVTLLGDAAHPMLPSLGQGANQAIEDAVVLARELASAAAGGGDQVSALRRYETRRAPRVKGIVDESRRLGGIEQTMNPLAVAVRDRYFQHVPGRILSDAMVKPAQLPPLASSTTLPRPLSPLERWHWVLGSQSPLLSIARVRLEGDIDPAAVRGALDALQQRHPLLRAGVETDDRGRKPRFAEQLPREIPLRVVAGAVDDLDATWEEELRRALLGTAFDFAAGSLLVAVLVSDSAAAVHDLVFVAPCLVADADGVLSLQRECLALLAAHGAGGRVGAYGAVGADGVAAVGADAMVAGEWAPARDVVVPGLEELFPAGAKGVRGLARAVRGVLGEQSTARRMRPQRVAAVREMPGVERRSGVVRAGLDGAEADALREAAEAHGVHSRSVVAAALATAVAVTGDGGVEFALGSSSTPASSKGPAVGSRTPAVVIGVMNPVRAGLALDAAVPPGALGSYQSIVAWTAAPGDDRDLWELARAADQRCAAARASGDDVAGLALLRAICPSSPSAAGKLARTLDKQGPGNVCLSYVESPLPAGAVGPAGDEERHLEVIGVEAVLTTSIASMVTVSATASPSGLALSVAYVEGAVPRERAERIAELVVDALRGAVSVEPLEVLVGGLA